MKNIRNIKQLSDKKSANDSSEKLISSSNEKFANLSDKKLLAMCREYGTQVLFWRQRFIGLLPEVNRRRLYEKKGYNSIFEFGKRMAGLSEAQIRLTINLEKRFADKPALHDALTDGKVVSGGANMEDLFSGRKKKNPQRGIWN
jgi:hypothetical protein